MNITDHFEDALEGALGRSVTITGATPIGGGCIHNAMRLDTSAGPFFAKWHPDPPPSLFRREAEGLTALRDSPTTLTIPRPIVWDDGALEAPAFLITEFLEPGNRRPGLDDRLGEGLALLHQATAPAYGFDADNYLGTTPQPNAWLPDWIDFFRERRLRHQLTLAEQQGLIPAVHRPVYDQVLDRLDDRLASDPEPPALIHGDLWSGNLHVLADGGPALIDPAAYYAHREAELGMTMLFGGFSPRVYDAYHATWPLAPGWRGRNGLYQLYHVLNHLNLFGRTYEAMAYDIARRYA